MKGWSRILSVLAGIGAGLAGIAAYLGEINPKYALVAVIISTFIAIFCERVQGGMSNYTIIDNKEGE